MGTGQYFEEKLLYADLALDAEVSEQHIRNVIHKKEGRRASPELSTRLEGLTGVPKETWIFGTPEEIISALRGDSINAEESA